MVLSHSISNFFTLELDVNDEAPITKKTSNPLPVVRPLFLCMALAGIQNALLQHNAVHPEDDDDVDVEMQAGAAAGTLGVRQGKAMLMYKHLGKYGSWWCIVTALIVWLNIVRLMPSYYSIEDFDEETFVKVGVLVWYLQGGLNIAVCLRGNLRKKLLTRLFGLWRMYCQFRSFDKNVVPLRRFIWFLTAGYFTFVLCNIILIAYIMYSDDPNMAYFTRVLYTPFGGGEGDGHPALKVLLLVMQAYVAGAWILPLWLFALVCVVNKSMLEDTRVAIQEDYNDKSHMYSGELESVRLHHEAACEMVECADDTFSLFVALGIATDIPLACFLLYMLIWPATQSPYLIIFNSFLLTMAAFHLSIIMWSASRVNTEAHAAFKQLHKITTIGMNDKSRYQMLVFLSRLQGPPIGMTAWELFTIDRSSLLTIISILLTYFVILIQLRMPSSPDSSLDTTTAATLQ